MCHLVFLSVSEWPILSAMGTLQDLGGGSNNIVELSFVDFTIILIAKPFILNFEKWSRKIWNAMDNKQLLKKPT